MFQKRWVVFLSAAGVSLLAAGVWWQGTEPVFAKTASAPAPEATVAVVKASPRPISEKLTISSELVPFQKIDLYAKESGYVKQLFVDYGTHVKAGQTVAKLEIPELQLQLQEDDAEIRAAADQVKHAGEQLSKIEAESKVRQLAYDRLNDVSKAQPGLVAQQEVDDADGKYLEAAAQVQATRQTIASAQNELAMAQAKRARDQALFDYSDITAPFSGVITKRFANLGALVQAGTDSATQAMPIAQLSEDDLFRLVIPVPESYVRYIRIGDPVKVYIPSLDETFPGRVARFSVDVSQQTRTMHTEVDVPNPTGKLMPGLYADARLSLARDPHALTVPIQAVHTSGSHSSVDVVNAFGRVEQRLVTVGLETSNWAGIEAGLRAGDLVVVSDPSALQSGEKVIARVTKPVQFNG